MASDVSQRPTPPVAGGTPRSAERGRPAAPIPLDQQRRGNFLLEMYRSAVGKKYVMAITGIIGLGFIAAHMVGNLHVFEGPEELNTYGEWLRDVGEPALPRTVFLWLLRSVVLVAVILHIHASYSLTMMNRRARGGGYESKRDYIAATFAARSMRWTGIIVGLFLIYHLADLSWGVANPDFTRGEVYGNVVASFSVWWISAIYIVANLALGVHIYHGTWSLFQSLGLNRPRFNPWRRWLAVVLTAVIVVGYIAVPIAVLAGVVE